MKSSSNGFHVGLICIAYCVFVGTALPAIGAVLSAKSLIARAISAAPPSIGVGASVMSIGAGGQMKTLRAGTNGWTCFPYDVGTPSQAPLCFDHQGLTWYQAAMAGKDPDPATVGLSYMLMGGTIWSNIHSDATKPEPGQKTYISIGPHVMILNAKVAATSGFPSGQVNPDTTRPFVMGGGTTALVILPVK